MDIFEFCIFYVICFSALFSLTPLGVFPPRDISFTIDGVTFAGFVLWAPQYFCIPWVMSILILGLGSIIFIVALQIIPTSATVLGTGVQFPTNRKYLGTVVLGIGVSGGLGITMNQMLPASMPLPVTFFLVWVWMILLLYSVIIYAGAGSAGE